MRISDWSSDVCSSDLDRARTLLSDLAHLVDPHERELCEHWIAMQRQRSLIILRAGQLLYAAITCFVGTSLAVAVDTFLAYQLGSLPTVLAALGVLSMLAASVMLARESALAVTAINEEMDQRKPPPIKT